MPIGKKKVHLSVKNVPEEVVLEFKAQCIRHKREQGDCLAEALRDWNRKKK